MTDLLNLMVPFALNLLVALFIVRFIYYPSNSNREYIFTFLSFNTLVYFISSLLADVELSAGFGFGLLALFSVLRYRTEQIPIKEMTYLFIFMGLPFMNALFASNQAWETVISLNLIVPALLFALEKGWSVYYQAYKVIAYEKIELIKPENHHLLLTDLRERTGLDITRCKIGRIDFLKDSAELTIYYDEPKKINLPTQQDTNTSQQKAIKEKYWLK